MSGIVRWLDLVAGGHKGVGEMLEENLMALAQLAGLTVVAAAVTDSWEAARRGFGRVLGRGDPKKEILAGQRLDDARRQLIGPEGADMERVRAELAERWTTRLADLLEEHPSVEADLRSLLQELQATLPAGTLSASEHAVAAARDVNISADRGAFAAGVVHGDVASPGPTTPGQVIN